MLACFLFRRRILLNLLPESVLGRREPDVVEQHHIRLRRGLDALNHLLTKVLRNGLRNRAVRGFEFITRIMGDSLCSPFGRLEAVCLTALGCGSHLWIKIKGLAVLLVCATMSV